MVLNDLKTDEENVIAVEKQREKIGKTTINVALSNHFLSKQRRQLNYLFRLTGPLKLSTPYTTKAPFLQSFCSCEIFILGEAKLTSRSLSEKLPFPLTKAPPLWYAMPLIFRINYERGLFINYEY